MNEKVKLLNRVENIVAKEEIAHHAESSATNTQTCGCSWECIIQNSTKVSVNRSIRV